MAEIRPFRGVRYDVAKVGALSNVIAPPYDVIDEPLRDRLYQASPYNVVRLEYNKPEPADSEASNRYTRAAEFLRQWRRDGILQDEDHPAIYVYQQVFRDRGQERVRTGFFARLRLEAFGKGSVHAHEKTLSGPKADRLSLYRAARFNLSPIFGLYPDPTGEILRAAEAGIRDRTPLEAVDHLGVINRLWVVQDGAAQTALQGLMTSRPVFIADGHHRYETGVAYRDELAASGKLTGPDDPANFCLMMLVGMDDPGLIIQPTHRLVSGLSGLTMETLRDRLKGEFELDETDGPEAAWSMIEDNDDQDVLAFGTVADGRWITARLRSDATMDRLAADRSPEWRALGVSIFHVLVLDHLLAGLGQPACRYVHLIGEVREDVVLRGCDLACLVPAATMEHVAAIASRGETMPPKSTYFFPKLLTGMVLNPL
jgi:uncharacterized protein (DUF1015 family)